MKIECFGCDNIFPDKEITLIFTGKNMWGYVFYKYLCNSCLKKEK